MADIYRFYRYLKEVLIEDDVIFQNNLFAYALTIQTRTVDDDDDEVVVV